MEREIREQAEVLERGRTAYAEALGGLAGREFDLVVLAARGSSDNAALYARYLLEVRLGIPVSLAAPSVVTRYGTRLRYPARTLIVGISQSGAAPDVAEMLESGRESGLTTVAITNTTDSRLARAADHAVLLEAGLETSVAATKTYSASLLALRALVDRLAGVAVGPELPGGDWIEAARVAAEEAAGHAVRCEPLFALGRGYAFSTAHEAALKLMECALLACKAYSTADFEHGPKALAGAGSAAIAFGGDHAGLAAQGCEIVLAPTPPCDEVDRPFFDAVFAQWLALHAARARGLDPDAPRHLLKVTETR